jgi:hypothetical protein
VGAKGTIKGPNVYELENPPGWEIPHALKFGETTRGRWLWISPENRDELFREAGVPTSQPEPGEEELDLERIFAVFEKNGMRFLDQEGH